MHTVLAMIGAVSLGLFALCEVGMAWPVAWWLYLAAVIVTGVGVLSRGGTSGRTWRYLAVAGAMSLAVALYSVNWTTRKPFLRDLAKVRPGMSEAEVKRVMSRYLEGTGWPAAPGSTPDGGATVTDIGSGRSFSSSVSEAGQLVIKDSLVYRHSNDGAFNSDWGIVSLKDGRVVGVSFSPD